MEWRTLSALALTLCLNSTAEAIDRCLGQVEPIRKAINGWAGESGVLEVQYKALTEILKTDPSCGIAYAQLSRVYRKAGYLSGDKHTPESLANALNISQKSVQVDPDCYLCQWELGNVFLYQKDNRAFEQQQGVLEELAKKGLEHQMTDLLKAQYLQQAIDDEWLA